MVATARSCRRARADLSPPRRADSAPLEEEEQRPAAGPPNPGGGGPAAGRLGVLVLQL